VAANPGRDRRGSGQVAGDRRRRPHLGWRHRIFGYLDTDAEGRMRYVSIADRIPAGTPAFSAVWRTFVTGDGIVFQTVRTIFVWSHNRMTVINAPSRFGRASQVDGRVYVPTPEAGLNVLEGGTLKPLPGTAAVGNEAFPVVLRYDERRLLIGTREDGIFLYERGSLTSFVAAGDPSSRAPSCTAASSAGPYFRHRDAGRGSGDARCQRPPGDESASWQRLAVRHGVLRHARS
jgi:hypothetical protein